ncbi:MAG: RluA family pseudouridine synthase [Pseudomonadota bacterium]
MQMKEITVKDGESNLRLDRLLVRWFPSLSRRSCREFIARSPVLVNGHKVKKGARVSAGDVVGVSESIERFFADFTPVPSESVKLDVIYRDERLLAVDKPPGIDTAPIRQSDTQTVLSGALHLEKKLLDVKGWKKRESGLLYRLDRDVSGVVLLALDMQCFRRLQSDSRRGLVRKTYLAVVDNAGSEVLNRPGTVTAGRPRFQGRLKTITFDDITFHPDKTLDDVLLPHDRNRKPGGRAGGTGPEAEAGREKIFMSRIKPLCHCASGTLVEIEIMRAFRHQIRGTLAALGHPVAGDETYGSKNAPKTCGTDGDGMGGGIMLHCWKVALRHPGDGGNGGGEKKSLKLESPPVRITAYDEKLADLKL